MLDILMGLGISEEDLKYLREYIDEVNIEDLTLNINLLKEKVSEETIRDLITSNPMFLKKSHEDFKNLINYLIKLNLTNFEELFEYADFVNNDVWDLELYIKEKEEEGLSKEEVINTIKNNPRIIDEV